MNNSYHIIRIQQYLNGELSEQEMYQLEREALDDPLLQDAIDGYRLQKEVSHRQLSLLQQRLANRIAGQARERSSYYFGWQRLGVAATACVLMVLVLVLLWMRSHIGQPRVTEKEVEVELAAPANTVGIRAVVGGISGRDASPKGGWESFNAYLEKSNRDRYVSGEVTLIFDVDEQGKPTAIQAVGETDDSQLLTQARPLLEDGPLWDGSQGSVTITFE